jgi:hypothetical protein
MDTDLLVQNGVGAHILQCKKLDFHYCDHGGSSKYFLLSYLPPSTTPGY